MQLSMYLPSSVLGGAEGRASDLGDFFDFAVFDLEETE